MTHYMLRFLEVRISRATLVDLGCDQHASGSCELLRAVARGSVPLPNSLIQVDNMHWFLYVTFLWMTCCTGVDSQGKNVLFVES